MAQFVKGFNTLENIKRNDLVDSKVKKELMSTIWDDVESFYDIKWDVVEFKNNILEQYLIKLKDELKDKDTKEAWKHLVLKEWSNAWIMAIQIVLESLWFEIWKIDGIFWDKTKDWVRAFQAANWLNPDWYPGKDTIDKLCEILNWNWWNSNKIDKEGKEYTLFELEGKTLKSYTISSISELPKGYRWKDPENYDVNNEETYPISYWMKVWDLQYRFFSNWRCSFDGKMYDTESIIDKINKDAEWYIIERAWTTNCKLKTISSISELPEGYRWEDPENYDVNNEETYPTSYYIKIWEDEYKFYSNWRCSFNKRMYNSKDIIEKMNIK